jgi:hypothetical protein
MVYILSELDFLTERKTKTVEVVDMQNTRWIIRFTRNILTGKDGFVLSCDGVFPKTIKPTNVPLSIHNSNMIYFSKQDIFPVIHEMVQNALTNEVWDEIQFIFEERFRQSDHVRFFEIDGETTFSMS